MKHFSMWSTIISLLLVVYMLFHMFVKRMPTVIHGIILACLFTAYFVLWGLHLKKSKG